MTLDHASRRGWVAIAVALAISGCAAGAGGTSSARPEQRPTAATLARSGLDTGQRRRADELVSQFETSTTAIAYCHVENFQDGRGYTVGRAGFTSANGDLLQVVTRYTRLAPGNPLGQLERRLQALARHADGSTAGLEQLPRAWAATCRDKRQRRVQDAVVDELYFNPATRLWRSLALKTPLSLAALYDALIQHGGGEDPDGVPALVRRATRLAHGTPRRGVSERRFLLAFLRARHDDLAHAHDPASRRGFAQSLGRVEVWRYLVRTEQWQLAAPVRVHTLDYELRLR